MKIFSLQSKWSLVGWSVVFSVVLNLFILVLTVNSNVHDLNAANNVPHPTTFQGQYLPQEMVLPEYTRAGWPYAYANEAGPLVNDRFTYFAFFGDLVFWAFLFFIVLSLIKYFKNKHKPASPLTR